jgi:hypothetical protein
MLALMRTLVIPPLPSWPSVLNIHEVKEHIITAKELPEELVCPFIPKVRVHPAWVLHTRDIFSPMLIIDSLLVGVRETGISSADFLKRFSGAWCVVLIWVEFQGKLSVRFFQLGLRCGFGDA